MKNVISWLNARKRWYGDNHWYWAVWIDVEDVSRYGGQEPNRTGFAGSEKQARQQAWSALKSLGPEQQRAYARSWARLHLDALQEQNERPIFSRCSIGNDRWYWW